MNINFIARLACLLAFGLALPSGAAFAQSQDGPPSRQGQGQGGNGERQGPPPQAIAACQGKASGAACSFVGRRGDELTGTCFAPPSRPAGGSQNGQQSSPPPQGNSGNQGTLPMACRPARH